MNKFLKQYIAPISLGLIFAASITFAWNAVWHGTDWIQTAEPIRSIETAENFEYLKRKLDELENKINNMDSSTTTITVENLPSGIIVAGCDLTERVERWAPASYTCWGGASVTKGRRGRQNEICPANTYKVKLTSTDTTGSHLEGGDGAQYTVYETSSSDIAFLCIKE